MGTRTICNLLFEPRIALRASGSQGRPSINPMSATLTYRSVHANATQYMRSL